MSFSSPTAAALPVGIRGHAQIGSCATNAWRAIGVSNFQAAHLRRIIDDSGEIPAVNQVELHPYLQQIGLRREHDEHDIAPRTCSPLGRGVVLDDPVIGALAEQHDKTARRSSCVGICGSATSSSESPSRPRIAENVDVFDFHLSDRELELIAELDRGGRIGPDPDTFVRP